MKRACVRASFLHRRQGAIASFCMTVAGRLAIACILLAMACTQPGCAGLKKRAEARKRAAAEKNRKKEPRLIGVVKLVNSEEGFVLIDSGTNPAPSSEGILKCKTGGVESAELRLSEIRRQPFVIADIVKGTPNKGDLVYQEPPLPHAM
jgi:hypothetical protein